MSTDSGENDRRAGHRGRGRLWVFVIAAWAVVLVVLGVWSAMRGPATVREQRDIDAAKSVVDRVVGEVSGQVPPGWRFFDDGYRHEVCEVSFARDGVMATRTIILSGPSGTESEAVSHLASGLPGASVRPGVGPAEGFFYDAGEFVAVRGRTVSPGEIVIELETGCRPA